MFEKISELQITGVISGNSTLKANIEKRASHTLIYKINGESIYFLRNRQVLLSEKTVLFIPEGESYSFEKISEGDSKYCLINFHCPSLIDEKPKLFSPMSSEHISYVFNQMQHRWLFSNESADSYELISLFYHLISLLLQTVHKPYYTSAQIACLSPAIDYLEEHIYDHELTVSKLATLCGISEVTFRNRFLSRFGESPKKYIIRSRLTKARAIMENGEYQTIQEVATSVGYEDSLYFSRHFKNFFGYPPSQI